LWLNLEIPTFPQFHFEIRKRREKILENVYGLAAYSVHPTYADLATIRLSSEHQRQVRGKEIGKNWVELESEYMHFALGSTALLVSRTQTCLSLPISLILFFTLSPFLTFLSHSR
jgi:hypothetical protein